MSSPTRRFTIKNRFKVATIFIALIVVFSIGGGLGYAFFFGGGSVNLQKGLVGYWDFGAGSTTSVTPDRTPYNNDGTVTGATLTTDRKGQSNKAYDFNGSTDYIDAGSNSSLYPTDVISVFAWIKSDTITPADYPRVVSTLKNDGAWKGYEIYQVINTGNIQIQINTGGSFAAHAIGTVSVGTWAYVGFTFDGTNIVPYFNGVAGSPIADAGAITYTSPVQSLRIGVNPNVGTAFDGSIDDVRVYNRALSATEITALYESYNPGVVVSDLQKGLVGNWKFDGNAKDSTPNSNHGTVTGATLTTDRKGQTNKAYSFAGDDFGNEVQTVNSVLFTTEFTMSAWFNATEWVSLGTDAVKMDILMSKWNCVNSNCGEGRVDEGYYFGRFYGGSSFGIAINNGADGTNSKIASVATSTISAGAWHNAVATFKGSTFLRLYIDGVLVNENTTAIYASVADAPAYSHKIGRFSHGYGQFYGKIDDVRIYNRALSAEEVLALYESYNPGVVVSDLQKGLVGNWDFGAGSTTLVTPDRTPNNNDGTVTGATISGITDRKGQSGKAYTFNGSSDNISIADPGTGSIFDVDYITVSAWIKPSAVAGATRAVINKRHSGGGTRTWELSVDANGKMYWQMSRDNTESLDTSSANGVIVAGNWNHVVGTYDGTSGILYVNGSAVGTPISASGTMGKGNDAIRIGKNYNNPDYFAGVIDDVRVYNRALSATEITALYESYR